MLGNNIVNPSFYKKFGVLYISITSGDPDDIGLLKTNKSFLDLIDANLSNTYCSDIIGFSFNFLIYGRTYDWGDDRIEKIKRDRKSRTISCNVVIGKKSATSLKGKYLKNYTKECLRSGLIKMIDRIKKDKIVIDQFSLLKDYDACI